MKYKKNSIDKGQNVRRNIKTSTDILSQCTTSKNHLTISSINSDRKFPIRRVTRDPVSRYKIIVLMRP